MEFQSFTPTNFTARFSKERQAGQYLWDLYVTGPTGFDVSAKKAGDPDPIPQLFILPEVLDEKAWFGGFDKAFLDSEKRFVFAFQAQITPQVLVNRAVCCGKRFEQHQRALGRQMERQDRHQRSPRRWRGQWPYRAVDRAVRRGVRAAALLRQDLTLSRDDRQPADWLARGRYPIAIGVNDTDISRAAKTRRRRQGRTVWAVKPAEAWRLSTGWGAVRLVNKAPHLNAATVFVNWLLSERWARPPGPTMVSRPSRRNDVARVHGMSPEPGVDYFDIDREERVPCATRRGDFEVGAALIHGYR